MMKNITRPGAKSQFAKSKDVIHPSEVWSADKGVERVVGCC